MRSDDQWTLFDANGARKYLCGSEIPRFLAAARRTDPATNAFCCLLTFTGCRLSEALAITPTQLDAETNRVVFRTLKRRRKVFRAVPVPAELMSALSRIANGRPPNAPIWGMSRQTAWRRVKEVMEAAGIAGKHATPKGLRHGFGVANAEKSVPLGTTRKWLGHAQLETTLIYQDVVGHEEHAFAKRLWRGWKEQSPAIAARRKPEKDAAT